MDCNASDASVADWLEVRLMDELKLVEGRQRALLTDLRLHLRQVSPAVQVIPPGVSGSLSPSLDVKTARGLLRPPEAVKEESEQVGVKDGTVWRSLAGKNVKHPVGSFLAINHCHLCM